MSTRRSHAHRAVIRRACRCHQQPHAQPRQREPPARALPVRDDALLRGDRALQPLALGALRGNRLPRRPSARASPSRSSCSDLAQRIRLGQLPRRARRRSLAIRDDLLQVPTCSALARNDGVALGNDVLEVADVRGLPRRARRRARCSSASSRITSRRLRVDALPARASSRSVNSDSAAPAGGKRGRVARGDDDEIHRRGRRGRVDARVAGPRLAACSSLRAILAPERRAEVASLPDTSAAPGMRRRAALRAPRGRARAGGTDCDSCAPSEYSTGFGAESTSTPSGGEHARELGDHRAAGPRAADARSSRTTRRRRRSRPASGSAAARALDEAQVRQRRVGGARMRDRRGIDVDAGHALPRRRQQRAAVAFAAGDVERRACPRRSAARTRSDASARARSRRRCPGRSVRR